MRRPPVSNSIGAAGRCALLLVSSLLVSALGCTNLDENPTSSITPGNFYRNESEVLGALAGVYASVRTTLPAYGDSYYDLSEISTDEMIVPTRGQDWYDNGRWLEIQRQLWTANSPSGLADINGAWVNAYAGIARANVLLDALQHVTVPNQGSIVAETRALRAFDYYLLMDMFGGVPIVTTPDISKRARNTRAEVFQFIEKELQAARDSGLPATWPAASNGRFTKGAADAILASMYVNAGVFTKDVGINATGYNSCQGVQVSGGDACTAAVAAADRVLNAGVYQLADTFVKNFRADNNLSPENIFVVKFIAQDGLGFRLLMTTLHYNQFNPSPWNGFATLAETYNAFDSTDKRRQIFLIGQQYDLATGTIALKDRTGAPLVFTDTIRDATQATEGEGPRIYKWPFDPAHVGPDNGNDFPFFRLAEMYLIKAEAEVEGATGSQPPLALLKAVRARSFKTGGDTLSAVDRNVVLRERLFELTFEAKRRQDLIRFGLYTAPRAIDALAAHNLPTRDPTRVLMPIPQTQIDANPLLKQNPGY